MHHSITSRRHPAALDGYTARLQPVLEALPQCCLIEQNCSALPASTGFAEVAMMS